MTINFSKYSTIKIGGIHEIFLIDEERGMPDGGTLIGGASNTLISPEANHLCLLDDRYKYIRRQDNRLFVGAKTKNITLFNYCKKHQIGGFEFLGKLPGTLGGSLKMNAGMKEETISQKFLGCQTLFGNKSKKDISFTYRNSSLNEPIFEAVFVIEERFDPSKVLRFNHMRDNQPLEPSLGSVFKNPENDFAGRLIESVGLKGERRGGMQWSDKHANFLVNRGEGIFEDALHLIKEAEKRVFDRYGIMLQREIKVIG